MACRSGLCYAHFRKVFLRLENWAQHILKLPVDWTGFYLANASVIILGIICASIGWSNPLFALAYPSLMLVNTVCFHILPTLLTRKFSPSLITAVLIFLPVCFIAYNEAITNNVSMQTILISVGEGILIMAYPVVLLKTKDLTFFSQKPS